MNTLYYPVVYMNYVHSLVKHVLNRPRIHGFERYKIHQTLNISRIPGRKHKHYFYHHKYTRTMFQCVTSFLVLQRLLMRTVYAVLIA